MSVSWTFWTQAVIAEVYTLNALFVAITLCLLLLWRARRDDGSLLAASLVTGPSILMIEAGPNDTLDVAQDVGDVGAATLRVVVAGRIGDEVTERGGW